MAEICYWSVDIASANFNKRFLARPSAFHERVCKNLHNWRTIHSEFAPGNCTTMWSWCDYSKVLLFVSNTKQFAEKLNFKPVPGRLQTNLFPKGRLAEKQKVECLQRLGICKFFVLARKQWEARRLSKQKVWIRNSKGISSAWYQENERFILIKCRGSFA